MPLVKQYPHYLFVTTTGNSVQDENGNWSDEQEASTFISRCRVEIDGRGNEIQTANGTFHQFTATVYLPKGDIKIDNGTTVVVAEDADCKQVLIDGKALRFSKGQLNSRLWL